MDIHRLGATIMHIPTRDRTLDRPRPLSRSSSHTSTDSSHSRKPMAIPGVRYDDAPPPLPPPRYNEELERGIDVAWSWGNREPFSGQTQSRLAPIKPGSSLFGGSLQQGADATRSPEHDDMDLVDGGGGDDDFERRGSTVSTIRSPSQADVSVSASIPSLVRRPPSPSLSNHRLHGEKPLAQENFNRSSQAYDQRVLSKIGKPNSPPHHPRTESTDSSSLAQTLSLQTKESKSQRLAVKDLPSASLDPVSRWVTSPTSAGVSPSCRPSWRDYIMDHRSPSMDSNGASLVLDPELFLHSRNSGRLSTSGSAPGNDDSASFTSRSNRGSYDQTMFTDAEPEFAGEDTGGFRNLNLGDSQHHVERRTSKQGLKRRAMSPPADVARDEKSVTYPADLFQKVNFAQSGAARSPASVSRHNPKHGSVSSTSSSVRQNSYASSAVFSVAGSSMTSISSFERHSPVDSPHPHQFITSAPQASSPATSIPPSRKQHAQQLPENKSASRTMSIQTAVNEQRPPPANRIGNFFICDCCPKKPKKFDREDELRAHQMEKQYSCQYCNNRFKNKNEAERHQNSLHLRRHSWSCAAIPSCQAAFHPSTLPLSQGPNASTSDVCGFCGEEFPNLPQPDWDRRIDHLTNVHKFGECNQAKKFYRADHFRQHLKHSHSGQSGKWTNLLESVCLREEPLPDAAGISPTGSESSQGRGPSSLPVAGDVPMGGATIDEAQEES